jgi:NAD(P)-dependent dehydrogenase (short-subunit alcohol dehydrogenase family)
MEKTFKNKVVVITGGASGIGKATAIAFAQKGAKVVIVDVAEHSETLNLIHNMEEEAVFIPCDVSNTHQVKAMIEKAITTYGAIDFAFNNAGIEGESANTQECSEENWDKTIAVNLK